MPLSVSAEDSAGVQASSSTVSISPSDPVEGSSITIRLTMYNDNNFAVDDVLYKFYWNGVASNKLIVADTVDIPAKSTIDVEVVKSGLTVGEHKVWITFDSTGDDEQMFFTEIMVSGLADLEVSSISTSPESVYSETKQICEDIIEKTKISSISLRYFNPVGTHSSILIGDCSTDKPSNLVPVIAEKSLGLRKNLIVNGNDYSTEDGTCIRDYIHVVDLAKAHIIGLKRMTVKDQNKNFEVYNLGTGRGYTVLEVIKTFEKISSLSLNYEISTRRKGDIIKAYADTTKANKVLGWKAELSLEEALISAWRWEKKIRKL